MYIIMIEHVEPKKQVTEAYCVVHLHKVKIRETQTTYCVGISAYVAKLFRKARE